MISTIAFNKHITLQYACLTYVVLASFCVHSNLTHQSKCQHDVRDTFLLSFYHNDGEMTRALPSLHHPINPTPHISEVINSAE